MNVRLRGLLIVLASSVFAILAATLLFAVADSMRPPRRNTFLPFALPLVGMLYGLLELATGRRFRELDAWFQQFPMVLSYPIGCLSGLVVLLGCVMWLAFIVRLFGG